MRNTKNLIQISLLFVLIGLPSTGLSNTNAASTNAVPALTAYYSPIQLNPSAMNPSYGVSLFWPQNGEDGARTWSQTKSMFFYAIGAVGVLVALPEESTGWNPDDDIFNKWLDNVKAGPEWDRNKWAYNYIGHMYFGGVYYQIARKSGYRQWDSFLYTALMSTFLWEYGLEAFAEVPSVQDLVFTPIAGWLYGEWAYQTEFQIRSNGGRVLGSRILGGVSLFFLDPVDQCGQAINWITRHDLVKSGYGYFAYNPVQIDGQTDHQVYLHVRIPIGPAGPSADSMEEKNYRHVKDDPVDYSIIGFGASMGHTALDNHWNVTDDTITKLHLGLYFTPRISTRFCYAWGNLQDRSTKEMVEYENYSLDTQLYLRTKHKFRPYLTGGLGRQLWYRDNDLRTFQWNGGVGAHWTLHDKLALNSDWITYYSPSQDTFDQQFNIGLVYRFGEGEHDRW